MISSLISSLSLLMSLPALAEEAAPTRRFALVIGANDGGEERVTLRYADTDAQAVSDVLSELGGVAPDDNLLLTGADREALVGGLSEMQARVEGAKGAGERTELLVYYSGHSDEEGLLPAGELYGYAELRQSLETIPADVRLLVLDSCASGAMVRQKGGVMRAPFLVDESVAVSGHAYLTSSSADEAAQESDRIGGSFFTHFLVTGMRGAADTSHDGRVTLNEAYHFAYTETLSRTERTSGGPQHAAYDIRLNGTGDLVMTDLSGAGAGLTLSEGIGGRLFIRDESGRLVAELYKPPERALSLGLAPGNYTLLLDTDEQLLEAYVELEGGGWLDVGAVEFVPVDKLAAVSRGDIEEEVVERPITTQLLPDFSDLSGAPVESYSFALGLVGARVEQLDGLAVALGITMVDRHVEGGQASIGGNVAGGNLEGAQGAVGANLVGGEVQGVQGSSGVNVAAGSLYGVQGTVGANLVGGAVQGVQASTGVNLAASDVRGVQATVGVNVAGGSMEGVQLAAGANFVSKELDGLQLTTGLNVASGASRGLQLGSGVNIAQDLQGAQMGLVNTGKRVDAQLGLVNVGREVEAQIGLINVAQDVDLALGLISISKNGIHDLEVFISEDNPVNLGLKFGGRRVYTTMVGGYRDLGYSHRFSSAFGLGARLGERRLTADLDVLAGSYTYLGMSGDALTGSARASVNFELVDHLGIFAGTSFSTVITSWGESPVIPLTGPFSLSIGDATVPWWPGLMLGVRLM